MTPDRENAIKILNEKFTNSNFAYPEQVIDAWKGLVNDIVTGVYSGSEDEYWNDLSIRNMIEEIGYGQTEEVKQADEEFRKTLIHRDVRNWGYDKTRTDDWWNFGYPKTLTGYLKDHFDSDIRFKN